MAFAIQGVWSNWVKRNLIAIEMAVDKNNAKEGSAECLSKPFIQEVIYFSGQELQFKG
jgi:hypothetical protein